MSDDEKLANTIQAVKDMVVGINVAITELAQLGFMVSVDRAPRTTSAGISYPLLTIDVWQKR